MGSYQKQVKKQSLRAEKLQEESPAGCLHLVARQDPLVLAELRVEGSLLQGLQPQRKPSKATS